MAKKQRKEPWNSRVSSERGGSFDGGESRASRSGKNAQNGRAKGSGKDGTASTVFLSVLVFFMFAIIGGAIFFTIWNNRNPNMKTVESNFYPAASTSQASSSAASGSSSADASSSAASSSASAQTYTVVSGDFPAAIAEKTGVSWDDIVKFSAKSTKKLDANNPGYYTDGSQLAEGDVLVISK
ncbi:LysM peptidoglycan-binding domain-containing protein [Lactovum odontotermitis]